MAPLVEKREALADYPRPADATLGVLELTDANRAMVERRRQLWSAYLRCEARPDGAVATRYAPLLVEMILAGAGEGLPVVPGSHYPPGFRRQLLGHTAFPADAIGLKLSAEDESDLPHLARLRGLLEPDSGASVGTLVSLAQLLNVLGLHSVAARALQRRAIETGEPLLIYEVARAVYVLQTDADRAVQPFHVLAAGTGYPLRVRLSSYARLIAHYCRRDRDLSACAEVAEAAQRLIDESTSDAFEIRMGISRDYRALALYAMRRRDPAAMAEMMRNTLMIAQELSAMASTPAERVAAAQNERLSLEASLKAFINTRGRAMVVDLEPERAVDRLLELDPGDPYTQLYTGDTLWVLGQDERALERFQTGGALGTYPGALAAHRAGVVLRALGRRDEAETWFAVASELDPAAGTAAR